MTGAQNTDMRAISTLLAVLFLSLLSMACADEQVEPDRPESAEPRTPVDEATVDQLVENPGAYDGAVVIVRDARYVPIEPEGAFVLEGEQARILVSAPNGVPQLEEGETVPVRAELVRFTEPAAEALGKEFEGAEELAETPTGVGDPYLLLRSLPESGADAGASAKDSDDLADARAELAAVVGDPESRYGDEVSVAGRVVRAAEAAFVLEADGQRLLVVPQTVPSDIPAKGATVRAQGEVERLRAPDDPAAVGETDIFDDFEGKSTLAASDFEEVGG